MLSTSALYNNSSGADEPTWTFTVAVHAMMLGATCSWRALRIMIYSREFISCWFSSMKIYISNIIPCSAVPKGLYISFKWMWFRSRRLHHDSHIKYLFRRTLQLHSQLTTRSYTLILILALIHSVYLLSLLAPTAS